MLYYVHRENIIKTHSQLNNREEVKEVGERCKKCELIPQLIKDQLLLLSKKSKEPDIGVADLVALTQTMDSLTETLYKTRYMALPLMSAAERRKR